MLFLYKPIKIIICTINFWQKNIYKQKLFDSGFNFIKNYLLSVIQNNRTFSFISKNIKKNNKKSYNGVYILIILVFYKKSEYTNLIIAYKKIIDGIFLFTLNFIFPQLPINDANNLDNKLIIFRTSKLKLLSLLFIETFLLRTLIYWNENYMAVILKQKSNIIIGKKDLITDKIFWINKKEILTNAVITALDRLDIKKNNIIFIYENIQNNKIQFLLATCVYRRRCTRWTRAISAYDLAQEELKPLSILLHKETLREQKALAFTFRQYFFLIIIHLFVLLFTLCFYIIMILIGLFIIRPYFVSFLNSHLILFNANIICVFPFMIFMLTSDQTMALLIARHGLGVVINKPHHVTSLQGNDSANTTLLLSKRIASSVDDSSTSNKHINTNASKTNTIIYQEANDFVFKHYHINTFGGKTQTVGDSVINRIIAMDRQSPFANAKFSRHYHLTRGSQAAFCLNNTEGLITGTSIVNKKKKDKRYLPRDEEGIVNKNPLLSKESKNCQKIVPEGTLITEESVTPVFSKHLNNAARRNYAAEIEQSIGKETQEWFRYHSGRFNVTRVQMNIEQILYFNDFMLKHPTEEIIQLKGSQLFLSPNYLPVLNGHFNINTFCFYSPNVQISTERYCSLKVAYAYYIKEVCEHYTFDEISDVVWAFQLKDTKQSIAPYLSYVPKTAPIILVPNDERLFHKKVNLELYEGSSLLKNYNYNAAKVSIEDEIKIV